MKRMLDQKLIDLVKSLSAEDIAWVEEMKEHISVDDSENPILLRGNGFNFNNFNLYAYELNNIRDNPDDDTPLFPLENNAGKVLAVNDDEDGLVAVEKGATLYKHTGTYDEASFLIISLASKPITEMTNNEFIQFVQRQVISFDYDGDIFVKAQGGADFISLYITNNALDFSLLTLVQADFGSDNVEIYEV